VWYGSFQPFPPEYFRQEIVVIPLKAGTSSGKVYFTLGCISLEPTARQKDHLLLKKTQVAALAFLQIIISSYLVNLLQKTSAEHGRIGTEETRALLSKARQNQSK
jgi:hypothetical protein